MQNSNGGCLVGQSGPTLETPIDCSLPGSSVHEILQERILSGLLFPSPGDLPTQESNPGLLHYRQILHQLGYKGTPIQKSQKYCENCPNVTQRHEVSRCC